MGKIKKVIMALVFLTIGCISVLASGSAVVEELRQNRLVSVYNKYGSAIDKAGDVSKKYTKWISSQYTEQGIHGIRNEEFNQAISNAVKELNAYKKDISIEYKPIGEFGKSFGDTDKYLTYGIVSSLSGRTATLINPEDYLKRDIMVNNSIYDSTRINNVKLEKGVFYPAQVGHHVIAVVRGIDNYKNLIISQSTIQENFNNAKFNFFGEKAYSVYLDNLKEPRSLIEAFRVLNESRDKIEKIMTVCEVCGNTKDQCICIIDPPDPKSILVAAVGLGAVFFIVIVVIVICIFAFGKSKKCKLCGSALVKGKCPNPNCPSKPQPTCNICGSKLGADGKCPECDIIKDPICNICGGILDANGKCTVPGCPNGYKICRFCGQKASNLDSHDIGDDCGCSEETKNLCEKCNKVIPRGLIDCPDCDASPIKIESGEETIVPADFNLKFIEPKKYANKVVEVPSRFVLGKNPSRYPGFVPAIMRLSDYSKENQNSCSRSYIQFEECDDGFKVKLLSMNKLYVDGVQLKTDETTIAKVGAKITIKPDWVVEVVKK